MDEKRKRRRLSETGSFEARNTSTSVLIENDLLTEHHLVATSSQQQFRRELFVRSLPASATTESLTKFFSQSYVIKHATVVVDPQTKQSRGYGFVTFADLEDAQRALEEFNGATFEGKKIKVEVARPRHREIDENVGRSVPSAEATRLKEEREQQKKEANPPKLIIRNLPWSISEADQLAALFRSFGKVKSAVVPKISGRLAGFGFVVLRGKKNAERALESINGKEIHGRTLAVDWAVDKKTWEEAEKSTEASKAAGEEETESNAEVGLSGEVGGEELSEDPGESLQDASSDGDVAMKDENESAEMPEDGEVAADDERNASTIFVRNLPFTCTDDTLHEHFSCFGRIRYARIVVDSETERPKGTGFVCFWSVEDATLCVRGAPKKTETITGDQGKYKKVSSTIKNSILQDGALDPSGRYTMDDRVLLLARAVSRSEAAKLVEEGVSRRAAQDKDKRRLFLLTEGSITSNSPLYKKLSPSEVKIRADSLKQRQTLVKNNPMLHLSLTRLSVRNIPRQISSKDLKALAREAVVGFARDVKEGLRQPLSQEELKRGSNETKEAEALRKKKGKGIVRQAKIVFEGRDGSKIDEKSGVGRSRGYGFIEYYSHRHALMGLRWLNGHAVESRPKDGIQEKKKHLIVEFAIENAQVVKRRNEYEGRMRKASQDVNKNKRTAGKIDDAPPKQLNDQSKRGTKRKRSQSRDDGGDGGANNLGNQRDKDDKAAKRNHIIARKRLQRRLRKSKT